MKTYKKIGLGLSAVLLFITLFIPAMPKQAVAAAPNLNLKFGDSKGKTITGSLGNNRNFTFNQTSSGVGSYGYTIANPTNTSPVCSGSGFIVSASTADSASQGSANTLKSGGIRYRNAGSTTCIDYTDTTIPINAFGSTSTTPQQKKDVVWDGAKGYLNADGSQIQVKFSDNTSAVFQDSNPGDGTYNYKPLASSVGPLGQSNVSNWCDNTTYKDGGGDSTHGITLIGLPASSGTVNVCYQTSSVGSQITPAPFPLAIDASGYKGPATTTAPQQTQCEGHSGGWAFAWAVCPVLEAANNITTFLVGIFDGQLNFSVSQLGTSTDPNSGNYKIHYSWSLLKDIASGLVIIIMLIMVLSQAASFGPFDAYTIRKMLPRLVAAVIIMQISWPLFNFVIKLVNDLAGGLAAIMYLPFGGAKNMDLWHLLYNAKLSNGVLFTMDWAAILVFGVLLSAYLFAMLGFALTAIIALFFGVLTLIFRKILIILLLIFSPIAVLAWILPGTKKYWDMWWNNFIKVLFMFPIIIGIIAAGRIFAYVVGTQDNGQFLNLIFVMVGFFGPMFLLPKTFKWGGQAMQMAGNGIMKASSKVNEKPKAFLNKRQEGYNAERQRKTAERVTRLLTGRANGRQKFTSALRGDYFKGGIGMWDPTLGLPKSRRRGRHQAAYIKAGEEVSSEEAQNYGRVLDATLRTIAGTGNKIDKLKDMYRHTSNGAERYAILARIAQFKDVRALQELRADTPAGDWNANLDSLYNDYKALDPELVGGFYKNDAATGARILGINRDVMAGMTSQGWVDFATEAQREGRPDDVFTAYAQIMGSEQATKLDEGAHVVVRNLAAAMGRPMPAPAPHGTTAPGPVPPIAAPAPTGAGAAPAPPGAGPGPAPPAGGGAAPAAGRVAVPVGPGGVVTAGGVIHIDHGDPRATDRANIISATDYDIMNDARTRPGGWSGFSDDDLIDIYNHRTGQVKDLAAQQLRRKGLL